MIDDCDSEDGSSGQSVNVDGSGCSSSSGGGGAVVIIIVIVIAVV
jgi:hypothetical protein